MKKLYWVILFLLLCNTTIIFGAQELDLQAKASLLMVEESGQVLYEENSDLSMAPASITKVMTMYLVMESLEQGTLHLDDIVTISKRAWEVGESSMFLNQGDKVAVDLLVQGLAVVSGNDASIALAEKISGSVEEFVKKMNLKAEELGLAASHFQNPHGLDASNHKMSARDIATLCRSLYSKYPQVIAYYTQESLTYGGISQENRNPLLGNVDGVDGVKTGFTDEAGYSIAVSAKNQGFRLVAVILGCESEEERRIEATALLDYGFTKFQTYLAAEKEVVLGEVKVRRGKESLVSYGAKNDFPLVIETGTEEEVASVMIVSEDVFAPFSKGQEVGTLEISYRNQLQGEVPLVAVKDVARGNWLKILWQVLYEFFSKMVRISK